MENFAAGLTQWVQVHTLGRKISTIKFNREIEAAILKLWPDTSKLISAISPGDVLAFGAKVTRYCPSRWNAFVSVIRFLTAHGKLLDFRAVQMREFNPPSASQFRLLLKECDAARRTKAVWFVRFLCLTGLRIAEARGLRWLNVFADRIEVPAAISKSGKRRAIPLLEGLPDVLNKLRSLGSGEFVLPRQNARKAIQSACRRAGITNMSHHCFRHYFATRCIEAGVDIPTVARWLGHQDGGALLSKVYFHLLDSHSHAMAARVKIAA